MHEFIHSFFSIGWGIYEDAGFWVVVSLITGGILHVFVPQASFKKWLGKTSLSSIALATGIGVLLPICSCGVVPLGLAMYWSGASLAATLAFMVATPIINPAAAFMAFGLLGPELAVIYVLSGFAIPPLVAYCSCVLVPDLQFYAKPSSPQPSSTLEDANPFCALAPQEGGAMGPVLPSLTPQGNDLPRFPGNSGCT